jgi:Fibronectin type III domain
MDERVSQAARGLLCGNRAAVARRRAFLLGSLLVAVWACSPSTAFATGSVTLGWDANVEPNIAGYTVYYRSADNYSHGTVTVGGVGTTTATLSNLRSAVRYYFSVSAFDSMGLSSSPSSEVSGIVPGQPDSTPGTPDPIDGGIYTYFAEGASGDTFNYRLAVLNTTAQNTQFVVQFLREGADPVVRIYTLPAFFRTTVTVTDIPELQNTSFGAVINAIPGVIAERTMSWNAGGDMSDATTAKALTAPSTTWYLAEGNVGYFDTFVLLLNPSTTATANVSIDFLTAFGKVVHIDRVVGPTQRVTVYTNNDVPELQNQSFGTTVKSDQPILVERAMYFRNGEPMFVGGAASGAVPQGATHWFLAEGQSGGFFATYVLVSNPNDSPVDLDIRYLTAAGVAREDHLTLAATQRLTLQLSDFPELKNSDVSTDISASAPIIAERTMYWPSNPGPWYGSHNSAGQTELATRWGLAEGEVGGPNSAMTYILLANPNSGSADVTLTYYRENGDPPVSLTRTVPGGSRLTVDSGDAGLGGGERFGVVVSSTQPIAVERSCYWNVSGQLWGSGSNEVGTKLP